MLISYCIYTLEIKKKPTSLDTLQFINYAIAYVDIKSVRAARASLLIPPEWKMF